MSTPPKLLETSPWRGLYEARSHQLRIANEEIEELKRLADSLTEQVHHWQTRAQRAEEADAGKLSGPVTEPEPAAPEGRDRPRALEHALERVPGLAGELLREADARVRFQPSAYRASMEHELKCWPRFFKPLKDGSKTFELRTNDRDFRIGDTLRLREWVPEVSELGGGGGHYTGEELFKTITYVTDSADHLRSGVVALGLKDNGD